MILDNLKLYADYYNTQRAIPSLVDGLKPSQRKIVYGAIKMNLTKPTKMLMLSGEVMKVYIHGDESLYSTMYRMAQDWRQTYPLFSVDGNIGSQKMLYENNTNSGAAAPRYLTIKFSELGKAYQQSYKNGLYTETFNEMLGATEPTNIFVPFPAFLLYNQLGIGVGVATNFPSFTLSSVIDYTTKLIDNAEARCDILPVFKDMPVVVNKDDLPAVYNGEKSLRLRVKYTVKNNVMEITNFPPTTCPIKIKEQIENAVDKHIVLENIVRMQDVSNLKNGSVDLRLRLTLKPQTRIERLIEVLNLETDCETTVPMNLTLLGVDNQPHKYSVRTALLEWIEVFKQYMLTELENTLAELSKEHEITGGLVKALDEIEAIVELIKTSPSVDSAVTSLESRGYTFLQAKAIVNMKLAKLANLEYQSLLQLLSELSDKIAEITILINDKTKFTAHIKTILANQKRFDIYPNGCSLEQSPTTRIKVVESHTVKAIKNRLVVDKGGVDITDAVMVVDNTVLTIKPTDHNKKVDLLLTVEDSRQKVVTVSKDNRIKLTRVADLLKSRKTVLSKQKDVCFTALVNGDENIEITTNQGVLSFALDEVTPTGKGTLGVLAVKLRTDEVITGAKLTTVAKHSRYTKTAVSKKLTK